MKTVDQKILQAIQESHIHDDDSEIEANSLDLLGRSFNGMFRLNAIVVISMQLIFASLCGWCVYEVFQLTDVGLKLHWMLGAFGAFMVFVSLRLWMFMELNRLSLLREMKRLELQVSILASQATNPNNKVTNNQ